MNGNGPSTTSTSSISTVAARKPGRGQFAAIGGLSLLVALLVLAYITFYFGYIEGEEFSSDTFTRRRFYYYEIPLVGLQVTPINRSMTSNSLELHLGSKGLVPALTSQQQSGRWDLVMATRGIIPESRQVIGQGEARVLCECLDSQDSKKENIWLDWTIKNDELAKVVWPVVAKLARQELYIFVPELLLHARAATDPKALKAELDALLAEKYLAFAQVQQRLGSHEQAIELYTEVLNHSPTSAEALVGRAKSLTSLGKGDKASADLAQAQSLGARL
jgi:hypothetical protein